MTGNRTRQDRQLTGFLETIKSIKSYSQYMPLVVQVQKALFRRQRGQVSGYKIRNGYVQNETPSGVNILNPAHQELCRSQAIDTTRHDSEFCVVDD